MDTNQGIDLLALAGGASAVPTNFAAPPRYTYEEVFPRGDETLEGITVKAARWKEIVMRGESLAVAFDMMPQGTVEVNFEQEAEKAMTPKEAELFKAWKRKGQLPALQRESDRAPWRGGESQKMRADDLTGALRIVYKTVELDRENLQWFMTRYAVLVPLLTAVAKIARAARAKTDVGKRDARDFQEHLAAARAISVQGEILSSFMKRVKETTRMLASSMDVVAARQKVVNPDRFRAGRTRVLGEEARIALGAAAVTRPTKWVAPVAPRGRLERAMHSSAPRGTKRPVPPEFVQGSSGGGGRVRPPRAPSPVFRPPSPPMDWERLLAQTTLGVGVGGGGGGRGSDEGSEEEMEQEP